MEYREMLEKDIPAALELWEGCRGICLRDVDSHSNLVTFLQRNPTCSQVALENGILVGVAMAGHDGRRGFLYHVAVKTDRRRKGVGTQLVERCLQALATQGILKCNILIEADNQSGEEFWRAIGWQTQPSLLFMNINRGPENA